MSLLIVKLILIFSSVALTAVIFQLIRQRKLREEYSMVWLLSGIVVFLIACFGGLMTNQLIVFLGMPLMLMIILSQSICLSKNADNIRDLAQHAALMEFRVAQLEANKPDLIEHKAAHQNGLPQLQSDPIGLNMFGEKARNGVNHYASVSD